MSWHNRVNDVMALGTYIPLLYSGHPISFNSIRSCAVLVSEYPLVELTKQLLIIDKSIKVVNGYFFNHPSFHILSDLSTGQRRASQNLIDQS